ncbi:MAG: zinc ribbon domain-containing protein [Dehalococcoidales bacterium]|nr:zinc ribbon domain-containing protein [Dehalococcoidales bacterium]
MDFISALVVVFLIGMLIRWALKRRKSQQNAGFSPPPAASPSTNAAPSAFCPQCGQPVTAGSEFCGNCGAKLR